MIADESGAGGRTDPTTICDIPILVAIGFPITTLQPDYIFDRFMTSIRPEIKDITTDPGGPGAVREIRWINVSE